MKYRILMAHNRYLHPGGEDTSFEADVSLLRSHGHEVILYEESNERIATMNPLQAFFRTTWSIESYQKVSTLIDKHRPDILHVQNFFPIMSPSIHHAASRRNIPVIQSLRNYRLFCMNALFLRRGVICEDCMGKTFPWPGILHACYRGSHTATAAVGCMIASHRLIGTWKRNVSRFIALTDFSRKKFIEGGLPPERIVLRPNFMEDPGYPKENNKKKGAVFVGMLHPWKGAHVLVEAWNQCLNEGKLSIVGDGPELERLRATADKGIEFSGKLEPLKLYAKLKEAAFLVFPSIWYEGLPRVIIEAFACGTPVIASRLGGAMNLIRDGQTGLFFSPGDKTELAERIKWAMAHKEAMRRMARNARLEYEKHYTPEAGYQKILSIYHEAMTAK